LEYLELIQFNALSLASLDVLSSFAWVAQKNHYVRPVLHEGEEITIEAGRHPVIEQQLPLGEEYVPNDVYLDSETQQIMMITGPTWPVNLLYYVKQL